MLLIHSHIASTKQSRPVSDEDRLNRGHFYHQGHDSLRDPERNCWPWVNYWALDTKTEKPRSCFAGSYGPNKIPPCRLSLASKSIAVRWEHAKQQSSKNRRDRSLCMSSSAASVQRITQRKGGRRAFSFPTRTFAKIPRHTLLLYYLKSWVGSFTKEAFQRRGERLARGLKCLLPIFVF